MAALTGAGLRALAAAAAQAATPITAATGPSGDPEPLCAVYHRSVAPHVIEMLRNGERKAKLLLQRLPVTPWTADSRAIANLNTPQDWQRFLQHGR
jgi:molybdopterin-guanine dinucleotide biosynthesis protein A